MRTPRDPEHPRIPAADSARSEASARKALAKGRLAAELIARVRDADRSTDDRAADNQAPPPTTTS